MTIGALSFTHDRKNRLKTDTRDAEMFKESFLSASARGRDGSGAVMINSPSGYCKTPDTQSSRCSGDSITPLGKQKPPPSYPGGGSNLIPMKLNPPLQEPSELSPFRQRENSQIRDHSTRRMFKIFEPCNAVIFQFSFKGSLSGS